MLWTLKLTDDLSYRMLGIHNPHREFSGECPEHCMKAFLTDCIRHDLHDADMFRKCFDLMETMQDNPQDEYQLCGGPSETDRWRIVLKPAVPAGWDRV